MSPKPPSKTAQINTEQLSAFLDLQRQEVELKASEIDLRKKELEINAGTAQASLEAEKEIQTLQQTHSITVHGNRKNIIMMSCVLAFLFATFAIWQDKGEIVKDLLALGISFAGGYGFGRSQKTQA